MRAHVCTMSKKCEQLCFPLHLHLTVPLEGHAQGHVQARQVAPRSPVLVRVICFLILPFPHESQGPSHSVQSNVDKLIIQFKTDSTKINSTS